MTAPGQVADRNKALALWLVSGFLALLFVATGALKLAGAGGTRDAFEGWGFPDWFRLVVGACEVAGGIGLLVPRVAPFAAVGLVVLMGGAIATHLKAGEAPRVSVPIALVALLVPLAWARLRRPPRA